MGWSRLRDRTLTVKSKKPPVGENNGQLHFVRHHRWRMQAAWTNIRATATMGGACKLSGPSELNELVLSLAQLSHSFSMSNHIR